MKSNINKFEVNIEKLEFPYNIIKRGGMYGASGENPDILFREPMDNTVDMALKFKMPIKVTAFTNKEGWNYIEDNGLGFPIYLDSDYKELDQPIIVDVMRKVNAGSNITKTEYSAGVNGTGLLLTECFSDHFYIIVNAVKKEPNTLPLFVQKGLKEGKSLFVFRADKGHFQFTEMFSLDGLLNHLAEFKLHTDILNTIKTLGDDFGTVILFKPTVEHFDVDKIAYKGLPFKLINNLFQYDKDLKDITADLTINGKQLSPYEFKGYFNEELIADKVISRSVSIKTEEKHPIKFIYELAFSKNKFNFDFSGSVNLLETETGKHITLVQQAIALAFTKFNPLIKGNDSKLGQRLFVLAMAINPSWNSQDKTKLSRFEDKGYNEREAIVAIANDFYKFMQSESEYFNLICERILEYKRATEKLSNIELLKSKIIMGDEGDRRRALTGEMSEVYECTSDDYSKRELYIVEGRSALGGLVQSRDKRFQALLPLRGKLANTSGFDEERLVDNKEVLAIINTIGCGIGGICDPSKSRYSKIIIATDQDPDGCLLGNTLIPLTTGEVLPISELANRDTFEVFSVDDNGVIRVGCGHSARITKVIKEYYKITLSTGSIIECTGNHPFMLRNKERLYTNAEELSVGTELFPFICRKEWEGFDLYQPYMLNQSYFVDSKLKISPIAIPHYHHSNDKITVESIELIQLENPIEVWDITVDKYHNFALDSGVFVHNSHIANLITTLFVHHAPELIKQGYLYKLDAPFYKVEGKKPEYFYHEEKDKIDFNREITKLKGLGSYTADESKEFLLDPKKRKLVQIQWNDEMEQDILEASKLMYSGLARKNLMIERGVFVEGNILNG